MEADGHSVFLTTGRLSDPVEWKQGVWWLHPGDKIRYYISLLALDMFSVILVK